MHLGTGNSFRVSLAKVHIEAFLSFPSHVLTFAFSFPRAPPSSPVPIFSGGAFLLLLFISNFLFAQNPLVKQWDYRFGGLDDDLFTCFQQTSDGGYILGGYTLSDSGKDVSQKSRGFNDYWIVKTDATGNIQWQNTIGGNDHDELYSIQQTADGGYILGGSSRSNISGDKTENNNGFLDFFHHRRTGSHPLDSMQLRQFRRRNQIAAPDQRRLPIANFQRPHLVKSQQREIPAAGVILRVQRLPAVVDRHAAGDAPEDRAGIVGHSGAGARAGWNDGDCVGGW